MAADYPIRGAKYTNITTAATTTVKSSSGMLLGIMVNTGQSGATITIYDNTAASGTKIGTFTATAQAGPLVPACGVAFGTGLTVVTAGGTPADVTIIYM
jgi:hypothetical protein